jgi:hypothetical protein
MSLPFYVRDRYAYVDLVLDFKFSMLNYTAKRTIVLFFNKMLENRPNAFLPNPDAG